MLKWAAIFFVIAIIAGLLGLRALSVRRTLVCSE